MKIYPALECQEPLSVQFSSLTNFTYMSGFSTLKSFATPVSVAVKKTWNDIILPLQVGRS